ncbi:MAG: GRP family sugar transporter [Bacteroidota bacterium]
MFILQSYTLAVVFCIITMLCWGSWANTQKLVQGNWRFELFYWDYIIGVVLFSVLLAFTLGSTGEAGRPFIEDLRQAGLSNLGSAFLGGIIFNISNILLVGSIAIAGMSVAFPVGVGLALVLGVVVNYMSSPLGNPGILFLGVGLIVAAMVINSLAYSSMKRKASAGTSGKGLITAILAGIFMGFFYKYVADSMFADFENPLVGKLSPYTAVFIFTLGMLASNFILNTLIMFKPFVGKPVGYKSYFAGNLKTHLIGVLGGLIWCMGMSFSIIASGKAGPAISYGLGQGATVVASIWGIFIWKEFAGGTKRTKIMLNVMLVLYVLGLALIVASR